jgi:hypothetical protein
MIRRDNKFRWKLLRNLSSSVFPLKGIIWRVRIKGRNEKKTQEAKIVNPK